MKSKIFLSALILPLTFSLCSCEKQNTTIKTDATTIAKAVESKEFKEDEVKKRNVNFTIVDEGKIKIMAPGEITEGKDSYVFGYFGSKDGNRIERKGAPEYEFGKEVEETYSFIIEKNTPIYPQHIYAFYFYKRKFDFEGWYKTTNKATKLSNFKYESQRFYTKCDENTLIPEVQFEDYSYFRYFADSQFEKPIITFGDLDEAIKDTKEAPLVRALVRDEKTDTRFFNFNINRVLDKLKINTKLEKVRFTREKENVCKELSLTPNSKVETYTTKEYDVYFQREEKVLYILFDAKIDYSSQFQNSLILPTAVTNIDLSRKSDKEKRLFANTFQFTRLFANNEAESIDITNMDSPAKLTNTSYMFSNTTKLQTISGLNLLKTDNVKDMSFMFYNTSATEINFAGINTENVEDASYMFSKINVEHLDIEAFVASKLKYATRMFSNSRIGNDIQIANNPEERPDGVKINSFNLTNVIDASYMFSGTKLEHGDAGSEQKNEIIFKNLDFFRASNLKHFFYQTDASQISFENVAFGKLVDFTSFFKETNINGLKLTNEKYSSIGKAFQEMLAMTNVGKITITELDLDADLKENDALGQLSNQENVSQIEIDAKITRNNIDLSKMFYALNLAKLNINSINTWRGTEKIKKLNSFLENAKASVGTRIDLSSWDLSGLTHADYLMRNAKNITNVNFGKVDPSKPKVTLESVIEPFRGTGLLAGSISVPFQYVL